MPPDARVRSVEHPEVIRKRTAVTKANKRKNKWGEQFKKLFVGKGRAKWAEALKKHGEAAAPEALGLSAKRKPKDKRKAATVADVEKLAEATFGTMFVKMLKARRWAKSKKSKAEKKKAEKEGEEVQDSEFTAKFVRVTAELTEEGRAGFVARVCRTSVEGTYKLSVFDEGLSGGTFNISSGDVEIQDKPVDLKTLKPFKIDWRKFKVPHRKAARLQLAGTAENVEKVLKNALLEHGSVAALCKDIEDPFRAFRGLQDLPPERLDGLRSDGARQGRPRRRDGDLPRQGPDDEARVFRRLG